MDEFIKAIKDRFTPYELIEMLDVSIDDLVDAFYGDIEEAREDLEDIMKYGK